MNEERIKKISKQPIPTKEECIAFYKELTNLADAIFVPYYEMAIEALEKEPCDDSINRQVVLNTLFYKSDNNCEVVLNKELQDRIKALPSVTPRQKIGYWTRELIINEYGGCIGAKMICSECGQDNGYDKRMKFCPNCGAKMEVEK